VGLDGYRSVASEDLLLASLSNVETAHLLNPRHCRYPPSQLYMMPVVYFAQTALRKCVYRARARERLTSAGENVAGTYLEYVITSVSVQQAYLSVDTKQTKQTPWPESARELYRATPLVGEVSANF
jgi:hypothetical protein